MREIHKGYIIPDYIVRPVEVPTIGSKPETVLLFRKDFDYKNREFLQYCMTERDIASPALREFFESTTFVMNVWEDPDHPRRWLGKRFTPEQYMNMVNRCEDLKYREQFYRSLKLPMPNGGIRLVAQYGKPKWPTGGGRSAHGAGKFFWSNHDVTAGLYKKYMEVDTANMNPRECVSRTAILFGNSKRFTVPPRIVLADFETGGTAMVSAEYAEREGIKFGDKLWPIKASAVVSKISIEGADMVIPKDAIKFVEHQDVSVLAPLMGSIPELSAKARSSVEKERLPKLAFDTMQWLFPELNAILDTDPRLRNQLGLVRRVVEGTATLDEMLSLAEFTDADGEKKYPSAFNYLKNGHPKEDDKIRREVMKVAGTGALKALCFKVPGVYGVAMPLTSDSTEMTLLMPPWMLPFRAKGSTSVDNVIGVESDWAIGCLGKDYDGDLAMALDMGRLLRRCNLPDDTFPSWSSEWTKNWVKCWMSLPEKKKEMEGRSVHQVMADGLKSYGLIGRATNMCMVVIDTMRATGLFRRDQLMGMYLKLMSTEVQPFVDALKYDPKELNEPVLESKYRGHKLLRLGMVEKYAVDPREMVDGKPNPGFGKPIPGIEKLAQKVQAYFRAVRGMNFEALAELQEDDTMQNSFYYRLSRLFAGWKPYQSIDLDQLSIQLKHKYPIPADLDRKRAQSFVMLKGKGLEPEELAKHRWEFLKPHVNSREMLMGLIATCWAPNKKGTKDTRFALFLMQETGVSIVSGLEAANEVVDQVPVA